MSNSLNLHELFDIDLFVQAQLGFFINLSQRAVYTGFTLINFSLWKIELAHDTISWVMIDDEEEAVEGAVEDQGAIRRNLRLVKAIVFPQGRELAHVRLKVTPVFENALCKLLEVGVVHIGFGIAKLIDVEPLALFDHIENAREAFLAGR